MLSCVSLRRHAPSSNRSADLPAGRRRLDQLDPGPQAAAADLFDGGQVRAGERRMQVRPEPRRRLLELAGPKHRDDATPDRARDGVAAERAAVLPGPEHAEDRLVGDDGRERHDPAGERLAQDEHVRADAVVLARERRPVRPSPVWISSATSSTPRSVQSSRARRR